LVLALDGIQRCAVQIMAMKKKDGWLPSRMTSIIFFRAIALSTCVQSALRSYMKRELNQHLAGNEVYYSACSSPVI